VQAGVALQLTNTHVEGPRAQWLGDLTAATLGS